MILFYKEEFKTTDNNNHRYRIIHVHRSTCMTINIFYRQILEKKIREGF